VDFFQTLKIQKEPMLFKGHTIILVFFALVLSVHSFSQDRIEGGLFFGASYYNGDLNPDKHFYRAKPAIGGLVRVVLNERLALKGTLTAVEIQGKYPQSNIQYPSTAGSASASYSFQRTLADVSGQLEINFFDYDHPFRRSETCFTPYLSGGIASTVYRRYQSGDFDASENSHFILSLPFGIGVKWKPVDWLHVGLEWSFRKTFVDDLDKTGAGDIDPADPYGFETPSGWHDNDWYSYAGVFFTFDLFHRKVPCNAGF
jgi:opacity protein-like surface antigen